MVLVTVTAAVAYPIAGPGYGPVTAGLNDVVRVCALLASLPVAILIMAGVRAAAWAQSSCRHDSELRIVRAD